jgi:putative glutamine amidotransferase
VNPRLRVALVTLESVDDYVGALSSAGAEVVLLDPLAPPDETHDALAHVQGICLPGGWDVDPMHYGEPSHPTVQVAAAARDALEFWLARAAVQQDVPLLAICRGLQVLNVALGGTLVQDIPDQWPGSDAHAVAHTPTAQAHAIDVLVGSRLHEAVRAGMARHVNSRHHQAVRTPGRGLRVTASAPDGVVEAIELPEAAFCVGVQWHPENYWRTGEMHALFESFVHEARRAGRTMRPSPLP